MTTQAVGRRRRPRGSHPKRSDSSAQTRKLPEYLEAHEVEAIIRATDNPRAKLLMLEQWRAGLRIAEALAPEVADLSLEAEPPTLRVRAGKGNRSRASRADREPRPDGIVPSRLSSDMPSAVTLVELPLSVMPSHDEMVVEAHGGRIWAESAGLGLGARFTFTLPLADEIGATDSMETARPGDTSRRSARRAQARVLVVDDDPLALRYVRDALTGADFVPLVTADPEEALRLAEAERPRLALLDLMLPGSDGIDLMKQILEIVDVPVIFLSAYGRDEIVARAIDSGAYDYMVKPFSPTELIARVRGALRRRLGSSNEPSEPFVLGDLTIDYAARRVSVAGTPVKMTPTEYGLLAELSINAGRALTFDILLDRVWGVGHTGGRGSVRTYVKRLRRKLGDSAEDPRYIVAEPRVGYRMERGEGPAEKQV